MTGAYHSPSPARGKGSACPRQNACPSPLAWKGTGTRRRQFASRFTRADADEEHYRIARGGGLGSASQWLKPPGVWDAPDPIASIIRIEPARKQGAQRDSVRLSVLVAVRSAAAPFALGDRLL
jgi:hypothetical protein